MDTAIEQMAQGAAIGLDLIQYPHAGFPYLYALIAIVSFVLIYKDTGAGHSFLAEVKKHFLGIFLLWLFFGYSFTTNMNVNCQGRLYQQFGNIPVGLSYSVQVIGQVMQWGAESVDVISAKVYQNDFQPSKMPFAYEKYFTKVQQAEGELLKNTASLAPDVEYWNKNCADFNKYGKQDITYNYSYYQDDFIREGAPPDCSQKGAALVSEVKQANQTAAQNQGIDPEKFARYDKRNMFDRIISGIGDIAEKAGTSAGNGTAAFFLRLFTLVAFYGAYLYAKVLPFFLKLLIIIYFAMYPFVIGMAMLPGGWKAIVAYLEGYLWISFIPVVIAAVDGFTIGGLNDGGFNLFDLEKTFIMLAKLAIVLSAPILTSFLLFGKQARNIGLSRITGAAVSGIYRLAAAPAYAKMHSMARGGPGGAGASQAGRILGGGGGWGSGSVVASTGGRGQPPKGTPVTTARSSHDMYKGNSEAFSNARAAVTADNSASDPDYVASQMVSGNIKGGSAGGELGGALGSISPEMLQSGIVAQVQDSASGTWNSVHMQSGAGGRISYSKPAGGTAADGNMAARLNSAGKGEVWAAKTVVDGYKFRYLPGGGANVAKLRWGNEMSSENLLGGDLNDFISKQEKKFV